MHMSELKRAHHAYSCCPYWSSQACAVILLSDGSKLLTRRGSTTRVTYTAGNAQLVVVYIGKLLPGFPNEAVSFIMLQLDSTFILYTFSFVSFTPWETPCRACSNTFYFISQRESWTVNVSLNRAQHIIRLAIRYFNFSAYIVFLPYI